MGCVQQNSKQQSSRVPQNQMRLPYTFKIIFNNIKLKNLPFKNSQLLLQVGKTIEFRSKCIQNSNNPHWKSTFQTTYDVDFMMLVQDYFKISVINVDNSKVFGLLTFRVKDVAIGPAHFDMFLGPESSKSRITFDLKMFQKVHLSITTKYIYCELKDQLMEQAYNFQFRIRSNSLDYQSDISPNYLNPYLYKKVSQKVKNFSYIEQQQIDRLRCDSDEFQLVNSNNFNFDSSMDENVQVHLKALPSNKQKRMRKSKSNNQITQQFKPGNAQIPKNTRRQQTSMGMILKKDMNWEFKMQEDSPQVQFDIFVDEFTSSSFEFLLWSNQNVSKNDKQIELRIVGNSIISMNKFYSENVSVLAQLEAIQVKEVQFGNKLWNNGQIVGSVQGEFIIKNDSYMSQMLGWFRTEEGIQRASLLYIKKDKYQGSQSQQIAQIISSNMAIDELVGKLSENNLAHRDRIKNNEQIGDIIDTLMSVLKEQDLYRNEDELIRAQLVLTDLAKNLLESADLVDEYLREPYYEVLIMLLNRSEFFISYLGGDEQLTLAHENRKDSNFVRNNKKEIKQLEQKIRIGLHYQNFLHKTLERAVLKIKQRAQNEKELNFFNNLFVIAFFRIPQIQHKILSVLRLDTRQIGEPIIDDEFNKESNQESTFLAEWGKNFYSLLLDEPRYQEHMEQLYQIIESIDWCELVFKSRMILKWFAMMLQHYRRAKLPNDMSVTWSGFPGYLVLVKHLLLEIKYTTEYPYSDEIKESSSILLENENLLNYFVIVIFRKTKLYDGIAVFYCLEMINFWFDVLKTANKKVPLDFNYQFLLKGLYLILDGQHALSIAKVLQLLYCIYPQLPIEIQKEVCDQLLEKYFFKCFNFWSKLVRWVYQHFLIYRIQHRQRNYKQECIRDIGREFECIKMEGNVHTLEEKSKLLNHMIYIKYTQMLEITIKMRKILTEHTQTQEHQLKIQLEAKSLKLKLLKKKLQQKKQCEESNFTEGQIDFSLEALKKSINSLTFSVQDQQYEDDDSQEEFELNENYLIDRSFGSIINLDAILDEIQKETKVKKKNHITKQISLNSSDENVEHYKRKVVIYHNMGVCDATPKISLNKELIRYMLVATHEWQELQHSYKKWFLNAQTIVKRKKLSALREEAMLIDMEPPEITLYIPRDESESVSNSYNDQ